MNLKKRLIAIISAALMLMTSCSVNSGEPVITAQDAGGSAGLIYSGENSPEPEQTDEVKLPHKPKPEPEQNTFVPSGKECFTEFEPGNYLADAKFDTDEYLPGFDTDNTFLHYMEDKCGIFETEDAWYFCREVIGKPMMGGGSIITKYDKKTGVSAPLCSIPDCDHRSKGCCAFLDNVTETCELTVYDGKLFIATPGKNGGRDSGRLFSISLDGLERNTVRVLPKWDTNDSYFSPLSRMIAVHRGYVYMLEYCTTTDFSSNSFWYVRLSAFPLKSGDAFTIFYMKSPSVATFNCSMALCGNDVYFLVDGHPRINYYGIYRWDSKTREGEVIIESDEKIEGCGENFAVVPNEAIYFLLERGEEDGGRYDIMKYSFSDKSVSALTIGINGGEAIFFRPDCMAEVNYVNRATIYGYDGEVKANIEFEDVGQPFGFDGEKIYFFDENESTYDIVSLGKETVRIDG